MPDVAYNYKLLLAFTMEKELREAHRTNSQAVKKQEGENLTLEEVKAQHIGCDGTPELDNGRDDVSFRAIEITDLESNIDEGMADNVVGESEFAQRIGEGNDLQCRCQQENLETSTALVDSCHEVSESTVRKSDTQNEFINSVRKNYSSLKVEGNGDSKSNSQEGNVGKKSEQNDSAKEMEYSGNLGTTQMDQKADEFPIKDGNLEPVFDGTEVPGMEASTCTSTSSSECHQENHGVVKKAVALKNFVRQKSAVAVSTLLRRLSGKRNEIDVCISGDKGKDISDSLKDSESKMILNPSNSIKMSSDVNVVNKSEGPPQPIAMKGRVILYTRLGCQECKETRLFLYMKRLRYVEINIDVYPSRKLKLEKISGSASVPKVFFNEIFIRGLSELKTLNESGELDDKIDFLITEAPSFEAPLPPLSGEDDISSSEAPDEMALIVRKMKESVVVKDRFCRMRWFPNCFLGSEAVDFLSEDQFLDRPDAVEFARKLASKHFFWHVLDETTFEDGNHLYRFLDDDSIVVSQCHNIARGITTVRPKPIADIASRLRFLSCAMFEAYASEDGRHIDYRSLHGSEEFARYLRTIEELQRVEVWEMPREEKLAFFINLHNMMAVHAILVCGHPPGAMDRRKLFGGFKYVIGGQTYSLSSIQNGILRGNQRPPYALMKPFGAKDIRSRVALPYPEPLVHFTLVWGSRSSPALGCYSPKRIDEELIDAGRKFLRSGGLVIDSNAKVAYASHILKWYSVDFGNNEVEVLKHVSNYLNPEDSTVLLDLLASSELKVIYQPFDWSLNN